VLNVKLVRIALWILCILSILPLVLVSFLRNHFQIELGSWVLVSTFSAFIFALLLAFIPKSKKTSSSPSNNEETT